MTSRTSQTARSTLDSIMNMRRDGNLNEDYQLSDVVSHQPDTEDDEGIARASSIVAEFMSATSPPNVSHTPTNTVESLGSPASGEDDLDSIVDAGTFELSREWFDVTDQSKPRLNFGSRVSAVFPTSYKLVFRTRDLALESEDSHRALINRASQAKSSRKKRRLNTYFIVIR